MIIIREVFYDDIFEGLYVLEKENGYYYWYFFGSGGGLGISIEKIKSGYPKLIIDKSRIRRGQSSGCHVGIRFLYQDGDLEQELEED